MRQVALRPCRRDRTLQWSDAAVAGMTRFAGNEEIGAALQQVAAAAQQEAAGPSAYWRQMKSIPGNTFILPDQTAQHRADAGPGRGVDWQYPFFRSDLVEAGLLPPQAPANSPAEIAIPPGMTVLQAIQAGLIR